MVGGLTVKLHDSFLIDSSSGSLMCSVASTNHVGVHIIYITWGNFAWDWSFDNKPGKMFVSGMTDKLLIKTWSLRLCILMNFFVFVELKKLFRWLIKIIYDHGIPLILIYIVTKKFFYYSKKNILGFSPFQKNTLHAFVEVPWKFFGFCT